MPQLFSQAHIRSLQKAQAHANDALLHLNGLREVAESFPDIKERVDDLIARHQLLTQATDAALRAHRRLSTAD